MGRTSAELLVLRAQMYCRKAVRRERPHLARTASSAPAAWLFAALKPSMRPLRKAYLPVDAHQRPGQVDLLRTSGWLKSAAESARPASGATTFASSATLRNPLNVPCCTAERPAQRNVPSALRSSVRSPTPEANRPRQCQSQRSTGSQTSTFAPPFCGLHRQKSCFERESRRPPTDR